MLATLAACAQIPESNLQPGEAPDLETTEAGLWMQMDRLEQNLQSSQRVVDDAALNDYLNKIACRLAPLYCAGVRVYVVDMPYFNATMAPNGMMEVWTGLLLRVENEAQLAFVLSHELAHYIRRHSLKRWVDLQNKTNAASVFSVLTSAAGAGYAGYLGEMAVLASSLSYSRDMEREADLAGLERLVEAGYDPREAGRLWQKLLDEKRASEKPESWIYLSTHPGTQDRVTALDALSAELAPEPEDLEVGRAGMAAVLGPYWDEWLGDELTRAEFAESEVLFRRLDETGRQPGLVAFYLGELYRKRGGDDDMGRAIVQYERALTHPDAPTRAHRSYGQALIQAGRAAEAQAAFARYLEALPDAPDRAIVEFQIQRLR